MNELQNKEVMDKVIELYKCHFTAKETATILKLSYAVIVNVYRGIRFARTNQYNRFTLSSKEILNDAIIENRIHE